MMLGTVFKAAVFATGSWILVSAGSKGVQSYRIRKVPVGTRVGARAGAGAVVL